jgi:lysophospholipase L1-like esterase
MRRCALRGIPVGAKDGLGGLARPGSLPSGKCCPRAGSSRCTASGLLRRFHHRRVGPLGVAGRFFSRQAVREPGDQWANHSANAGALQQDVVHLHPAAVVILAATNDIAGNTGPTTQQMIEDNFTSMADIAKQNGIKVVFASITPAFAYPWKPGIQPVERIRELNKWLQDFCSRNGFVYLDYYSAMADREGAMLPGLSSDGVHPTAKGYAVMAPLAERAIAQALGH